MTKPNGASASVSADMAERVLMPTAGFMPKWSVSLFQTPSLHYEQFREALRRAWGRYNPVATESKTFDGKTMARSVFGLEGIDLTYNNAQRIERTQQDARLDGMDHYYLVFSLSGRVMMTQNDQVLELMPGDVTLIDSARPVTYTSCEDECTCFGLQFPRRSIVSHLGFEPRYGQGARRDKRVARVLFQIVRDAVDDEASGSRPDANFMRLAVYDLLGALVFAPDTTPVSLHSDKLFRRLCDIIRDRFADPRFQPSEVAAEAGISPRYVQKLFSMRGLTCTQFINAVRLDHAASLLRRRAMLNSIQPISEIAYASGFGDYAHFGRQFRNRFGRAPMNYAKCRD